MEALLRSCRVPALGARQRGVRARHGGTPGRSRRLLLSQLFQPLALPVGGQAGSEGRPGEPTCRSQRLMLQGGLIHPTSPGCFCYLPPTVRAMEKLIKVMDEEMQAVGGQKLNLPSLCSAELWRASGRWDQMGPELFRLVDRHKHGYCLGPTHEEVVTALVASQSGLSYKQLPLRLYQVTRKFRDEPKPRFGLLRSREFYMKDMYTFDSSEEAARRTYEQVCAAYCRLFARLGLPFVKVQAATGSIGGTTSHEFQLPADIGEDRLLLCPQGHFAANVETLNGERTSCPTCGEKLTESKGIEVGHTFYLGTKYSSVANAVFSSAENKPQLAEMGCYGLGVTRILAASIEVLSTEDGIRWPGLIAPYQLCFIPPKRGSREEEEGAALLERVYDELVEALPRLAGDSVLDDRSQLTIGKRLKDAKRLGYPYVVVAGKRVCEDPPVFEVWNQNASEVLFLTKEGVIELLSKVQVP
ncbi:probable proline--tRNA ligase, mitochondrial [Onychostruthus taczanowskii]|uniref:probable proline--tRNA ligase, mitochondrial n=1 Tax=Onychostruthus taczanowskii TaxID=356909 RepID=UPI001B8031EE|nr:probable proline--tRNA ligase, mitochondrial [Onychostruthus taczanowskii]XP_041277751.1 probable proline--tRNA ligase, mitochondrial [Onychostruthus taczanowskii]